MFGRCFPSVYTSLSVELSSDRRNTRPIVGLAVGQVGRFIIFNSFKSFPSSAIPNPFSLIFFLDQTNILKTVSHVT